MDTYNRCDAAEHVAHAGNPWPHVPAAKCAVPRPNKPALTRPPPPCTPSQSSCASHRRVAKVVEPKRVRLRAVQQQLHAADAALAAKRAALRGVVERVEALRTRLSEAQAEQRRLNDQARGLGERVGSSRGPTGHALQLGLRLISTR